MDSIPTHSLRYNYAVEYYGPILSDPKNQIHIIIEIELVEYKK